MCNFVEFLSKKTALFYCDRMWDMLTHHSFSSVKYAIKIKENSQNVDVDFNVFKEPCQTFIIEYWQLLSQNIKSSSMGKIDKIIVYLWNLNLKCLELIYKLPSRLGL